MATAPSRQRLFWLRGEKTTFLRLRVRPSFVSFRRTRLIDRSLQPLCDLVSQATSVSTSLELAANSGEMKPFFEKHLPTSKTSSHPVSPNHPASLPKTRNLPPPLIFLPIPSPSPMMRRINISQRRNPWTRNLNPPFLHSRRSALSTRLTRHTSAFSVGLELVTSFSLLSILPRRPRRNPLPTTLSFAIQLRLLPFLLNPSTE